MKSWNRKPLPIVYNTKKSQKTTKTFSQEFKKLWHNIKFRKKKQTSIFSFDEQEYQFFAELLEHGYPLLDALRLLHKDEQRVHDALEAGISFEELLIGHRKDRFAMHLTFFLQVSSVSMAIQSAQHMRSFEQGIQKKFIKQCSYPAFLFVFAFVILWMFTRFIIPQMLMSFSLDGELATLLTLMKVLQIGTILIVCVLCALVLLYIISGLQKKRAMFLYQHARHVSLLKEMVSYQLSGYLYELVQKGISTREAMQYLLQLQQHTVFYLVIQALVNGLQQGMELSDCIEICPFFTTSFRLAFQMGAYNDSMNEMLTLYMKQQELEWDKLVRRVGLIVQCVAYLFIASMVMIVYQIMLVPLSMLDTM